MLATLFGRNLSSSDFSSSLSYLSRKKGTSETFLSLSLFISRPRPTASASKIRLRLRKTFPQFPFFYFGNLEKLKSDEDKFFLRVASTIIETKYYLFNEKKMPKTTHCALRTWRLKPELVAYNAITNSTSSSARGLHMGDINPLPLNLIWHHFKFNLSDVLAKNCICIVPTMHVHRIMLFLPRWHIKNRNLLGQSHDPSTLKIACTFSLIVLYCLCLI